MSHVISYIPLDCVGEARLDLDQCPRHIEANLGSDIEEADFVQPWQIQHLYLSRDDRWIKETLEEMFIEDKDGGHDVWVHVYEEITPLVAARICWKRLGRTPVELHAYQDAVDRESHAADPAPTPPKGEHQPTEALVVPAAPRLREENKPPGVPAAATRLGGKGRTAELVKFLESRPGRKATLEEITLNIYNARPGNVAIRSRTTRKMAERARTKLERDDASVRLSIEKKTVSLVPASGDAT